MKKNVQNPKEHSTLESFMKSDRKINDYFNGFSYPSNSIKTIGLTVWLWDLRTFYLTSP